MKLVDPGLLSPKGVVVGVRYDVVPEGNGAMQVIGVDSGKRAEFQIPLKCVVGIEVEAGVLVLIGLLKH